jgi:molecular chaperone GrpE
MTASDPKNSSDPRTEETPSAGADGGRSQPEGAQPDGRRDDEQSGWNTGTDELYDPAADIERLELEKSDLTDRLLRLAADMDNLRRRTEREVADARKYAVQKFAADMLVVNDNLQRALEAVPAERHQSGEDAFKALIEGVELTRREMDRLLQRNGVARIAAEGERFDPNRHQAVFEIPNAEVPTGTVIQVMQDGFTLGDRVLRAAMVGVSKDGPKPSASNEGTEKAGEQLSPAS